MDARVLREAFDGDDRGSRKSFDGRQLARPMRGCHKHGDHSIEQPAYLRSYGGCTLASKQGGTFYSVGVAAEAYTGKVQYSALQHLRRTCYEGTTALFLRTSTVSYLVPYLPSNSQEVRSMVPAQPLPLTVSTK